MDRGAVRRWIEGWAHGWAAHDVPRIAALYADGRVQRSEPFREREEPAGYAAWAFTGERSAEVSFAEPFVIGPESAACEWWAVSAQEDGSTVTIAGVSLLHFTADGVVDDQRDYWSERDGSHAPPGDWGPVAVHLEQPS
jgi:hypothetical protein